MSSRQTSLLFRPGSPNKIQQTQYFTPAGSSTLVLQSYWRISSPLALSL